jgi:hypothetical protein
MSAAVKPRRFPPPWSIEERPACFIARDGNGQPLTYVYYEEDPSSTGFQEHVRKRRGGLEQRAYQAY